MAERWLYLLPEGQHEAGGLWPCLAWTMDGETSSASLAEHARRWAGLAVVLVLPMELFGSCRAGPVPGRRPKREVLEYAVEEQLAASLEEVHVAFGPKAADGCREGLVIARAVLQQILALMRGHGVEPLAVHADADLLRSHEACALWLQGRWLIGGKTAPLLVATEQDLTLLAGQLPSVSWMAQFGSAVTAPGELRHVCPSTLLMQGRTGAIDLLQGPFGKRRREWPWSSVAGVLTLTFAMVCLADQLRLQMLLARTEMFRADMLETLRQTHPGLTSLDDLPTRLQHVPRSPQVPSALAGLAAFAEHVVETGNVRIEQARLSATEGWQMELVAQDFTDMDRLQQRLANLDVSHAQQGEHGVRARVSWEGRQ